MLTGERVIYWVVAVYCFCSLGLFDSQVLPREEADALRQISLEMGATIWEFNADLCDVVKVGVSVISPSGSEGYVECNCNYENNSVCHVTKIVFKSLNLPGVLPQSILRLPFLQDVDFAYNLLTGSIPEEWGLTRLKFISVLVNRLSGEIPKILGNITSLTYLNLEANYFLGSIPSDIGKLTNLKTLILSSNQLIGDLPLSLSGLTNIDDFRINGNNLSGRIPDFIQQWKLLTKLEMQASGLEGPIPYNITYLSALTNLRITDLKGPAQEFPLLRSTTSLSILLLRNCNITGEIPDYIWRFRLLEMLDLSFNKLVGGIRNNIARRIKIVFLNGNMLSGNIPGTILKEGGNVDLSFNNFTLQTPNEPACQANINRIVNLFKGSSTDTSPQRILPCNKGLVCPRYECSLHVNCGGQDLVVKEGSRKVTYEGDTGGDSEKFFSDDYWGFVSTGHFMDVQDNQNSRVVKATPASNLSGLYTSARLSPLSLIYFHYCLENGSYNVSLHFAEIIFTNDSTYNSLGRRMFDIHIQGELVKENFNIAEEAGGFQRPVIKSFNASVEDGTLEILFYWASKGTTRIPNRGDYGSLISAISVNPNFKRCSYGKKKITVYIVVPIVLAFVILMIVGSLWWKFYAKSRKHGGIDFEGLEFQTVAFTLKQIRNATNNFDSENKIGEGGFGPVYKGLLSDGTVIAVKQLSARSRQGNREFLNEIGMISCLQHPNLVKLYGCCIEGDQLMVVYEYMENNSLGHVLFGSKQSQLMLNWPTRFAICVGIARGLTFLHNESRLKIVHRDIKATNVLLDKDLTPKISDFGLARLNEDENTHISTKVAGTIGYMAPEYALWGYLTDKADVYSFGVVILELVSGKSNNNYMPSENFTCLLDLAFHLQERKAIYKLVDESLVSRVNKEEVERVVNTALLCTNATPSIRPTMSEVVQMLEGKMQIPTIVPEGSTHSNDVRFKAIKDMSQEMKNQTCSSMQTQNSTIQTSSISGFFEITGNTSSY